MAGHAQSGDLLAISKLIFKATADVLVKSRDRLEECMKQTQVEKKISCVMPLLVGPRHALETRLHMRAGP